MNSTKQGEGRQGAGGAQMKDVLYPELSFEVIGAAMEVHRTLGPGFLEAVYHHALAHELALRAIPFESKKALPVTYKNLTVGQYEADIVVDGKIILELKCASGLNAAHFAQANHYLAATGLRLAILINFGAKSLESKRIVR